MRSREIIALLVRAGFERTRTNGSHHRYEHPVTKRKVTIVHPDSDVPIGTLKAYERDSGVKLRRP